MCWDFLPDNNVFTLYRLGQKGFDLLNEGVQKIVDIPADYRLSGVQKIQLASIRNRRPSIDKPAIKAFLTSLNTHCTILILRPQHRDSVV